ncbi:hypothetical protein [Tamlana crocina]|nr:hypothetical protein [Tamlana crocina]
MAQQKDTGTKIILLTNIHNYQAGEPVVLKFSTSLNNTPPLYCSNSYGSTLILPKLENQVLEYELPHSFTKKIGIINWTLLQNESSISGTIIVKPKAEVAIMETYLGPTSIEAGEVDYSMLVVIPTDSLDNPVPSNTLVNINHQFLNSENSESVFTKNLIAHKNIHSKKESGRMLVSSESLGTSSKEFTVIVSAAIPTGFTISSSRPHQYADGNQITTFSTSVIKDKHNNIVSDGTFVTFFITNSKDNILKTSGTTIDGVASAKIIHPDYADDWTIKAFVEGISESNEISISFKQVIEDFTVSFSERNRIISVGPLQSFMKQLIPDGLQVKLIIYHDNKLIDTIIKTAFNGFVNFNLKPEVYKNGNYNFTIETAGLTKEFKSQKLW